MVLTSSSGAPPRPVILLASASPRRREILRQLGVPFEAVAVDADERALPDEAPGGYIERVVADKWRLARPLAAERGLGAVLVADTTVVLGQRMLAKPADDGDNQAMIEALAGRWHEVMTRFLLQGPAATVARTVVTRVRFRDLTADEIGRYVASGEGRDKAGGYAIQGLGSFLVEAIEGSYASVVGLPACEVARALVETGALPSFPLSPR